MAELSFVEELEMVNRDWKNFEFVDHKDDIRLQKAAINGNAEALSLMKDYCKLGEDDLVKILGNYPESIQYIENPSEQVQLAAVNKRGGAIQYIKNPTEKVQLAAVNQLSEYIQYIENPSEQAQLAAVNLARAQECREILKYIKNPTEQVQMAAATMNYHVMNDIKNPSEKVQLAVVSNIGDALQYIKNPSEQVQLAAVNTNSEVIRYIKNPSEQVKLAAVNSDGYAIQYIENPSENLQLAAVNSIGSAIKHIKNPSEQVKLAAVNNYGYAIQYIENPSEKVQLAAINNKRDAIKYIKNPTERVKKFAETGIDPGEKDLLSDAMPTVDDADASFGMSEKQLKLMQDILKGMQLIAQSYDIGDLLNFYEEQGVIILEGSNGKKIGYVNDGIKAKGITIKAKDKDKVTQIFYKTLVLLSTKLPFTCSHIVFKAKGEFSEGSLVDSKYESGCMDMELK